MNGEAAINEFSVKQSHEKNHFVLVYHPKCALCKAMAPEWKKLANYVQEHNLDVSIDAVNVSKTDSKKLGTTRYPSLSFFPKGKDSYKNALPFKKGRDLDAFLNFLTKD